jgi:hypothetical protein
MKTMDSAPPKVSVQEQRLRSTGRGVRREGKDLQMI